MRKRSVVFEKTYREYLRRIASIDFMSRADMLGAEPSENTLTIPFYGEPYRISADGVVNAEGKKANFAICVLLCQYVLRCPEDRPATGDWVTYREFKDAGPLVGYFATNTNKTIETEFAGKIEALKSTGEALNGVRYDDGSTYDLSMKFDCLPRIPVLLRFNDRDDEFPAQCSILFRQSAEKYLDMESLAIGGTFLSGMLIGRK